MIFSSSSLDVQLKAAGNFYWPANGSNSFIVRRKLPLPLPWPVTWNQNPCSTPPSKHFFSLKQTLKSRIKTYTVSNKIQELVTIICHPHYFLTNGLTMNSKNTNTKLTQPWFVITQWKFNQQKSNQSSIQKNFKNSTN